MLWTALVPWTVLCLAGFAAGDDDFDFLYWYPGRRKLASVDNYEFYDYESSKEFESSKDFQSNDFYESKNSYIDDYVDDYPQMREDYGSHFRADSENPEDTGAKRRQGAHFIDKGNPYLGNYLSFTKLSLYNRNQKEVQVIKASQWFDNFDFNKDLVIMVHGFNKNVNYVQDFFNTIAYALLQNSDYNIIGIDWRHFIQDEKNIFDVERNAEEAMKIGHVLNTVVDRAMNQKYPMQVPRTSYIGHDLGSIPVVVQSTTYGFAFDSVYGLNQRPNLGSYNYLALTQLHGHLVQTLSSMPYPYSLSHRDYIPIYDKNFGRGRYSYQILANSIIYGNISARYCSNKEDYLQGYCSRLPEVPLWYRQMPFSCGHPVGKYFFELPSPSVKPYCDGQAFVRGGDY